MLRKHHPPPTPACNPNSPLLKLDSTGAKAMELQRYLVQLGYGSLLGQGGIDRKFGLSTQNAVKKFQQDAGLQPVDGIVGPRTWNVLCEVITSVAATTNSGGGAAATTNSGGGAAATTNSGGAAATTNSGGAAATTRARRSSKTNTFRADKTNLQ